MKITLPLLVLTLALASDAGAADHCFGAVGQQCGGLNEGGISVAACTPMPFLVPFVACAVSGGSMTHDPCCADNPHGKVCGQSPENPNLCSAEWDRAVRRFVWGYQWSRVVDPRVSNTSGNVVRADYCARRDSGVHKNDVNFCCSGEARRATFWERIGRPNLRICK
jgi:hypothetical protein